MTGWLARWSQPADGDVAAELITRADVAALTRVATAELPAHLRAFAAAHAAGTAPPPAPIRLASPAALAVLRRGLAVSDVDVHAAALALLRIAAPLAIDSAPGVIAARLAAAATPTWADLHALHAARDVAASRWFGAPHLAVRQALFGVTATAGHDGGAWPARLDAWHAPDGAAAVDPEAAWRVIAVRYGASGDVRILRSIGARPRAFVVDPGREVIVVVPARADTPVARFEILHELGHAVAALVGPVGLPRVLDEAVAATVARWQEFPTALPPGWHSPLAAEARVRRGRIARRLAAIEAAPAAAGAHAVEHATSEPPAGSERSQPPAPWAASGLTVPPWALWHDPGAQAAYACAETVAQAWADADVDLNAELQRTGPRGDHAL